VSDSIEKFVQNSVENPNPNTLFFIPFINYFRNQKIVKVYLLSALNTLYKTRIKLECFFFYWDHSSFELEKLFILCKNNSWYNLLVIYIQGLDKTLRWTRKNNSSWTRPKSTFKLVNIIFYRLKNYKPKLKLKHDQSMSLNSKLTLLKTSSL